MLAKLRARREDGERGFTLIELMVVVLIIAILIAIAIPTFLGAQEKAKDRAAQSSLRNALTTEKTHYTDAEAYGTDATLTAENIEPSLQFVAGASTGPKVVSVLVTSGNDQEVTLAALSKSGKCYFMKDNAQGPGTTYNSGSGTCSAASAPTTGWSPDGF